jgi:hypothetical protein
METQVTELVQQVLTLQWATWAIPVSIVLSLFVRRFIPIIGAAVLGVVVHMVGPVVLPALLGGESLSTITTELTAMIPNLNPAVLGLDLIAYTFLIFVFSLTRRDMFRHYAAE